MLRQQCTHKGYLQKTVLNFFFMEHQAEELTHPLLWNPGSPLHSSRLGQIQNLDMRFSLHWQTQVSPLKRGTPVFKGTGRIYQRANTKRARQRGSAARHTFKLPMYMEKEAGKMTPSTAMFCHGPDLALSKLPSGFIGGEFLTFGCTLPISLFYGCHAHFWEGTCLVCLPTAMQTAWGDQHHLQPGNSYSNCEMKPFDFSSQTRLRTSGTHLCYPQ